MLALGKLTKYRRVRFYAAPDEARKVGTKEMRRFLEERLGAKLDQESVTTAMAARCSSLTVCYSRDIVLFAVPGGDKAVGEVWFHASVSGTMISLVSVWTVTRYDDTIGVLSLVETDDDVQLVHTTDIITAMVQGSWQTTEFTVRVPHVREFSNARVLSRPKPHRASLKNSRAHLRNTWGARRCG